jgi:hypothetical protein
MTRVPHPLSVIAPALPLGRAGAAWAPTTTSSVSRTCQDRPHGRMDP